jgi:hypothetical protein
MSECWVYHKTEAPKIVDAKEAKALYEKGWADSPAKWLDLSKQVDMTNRTEVQMVGEVIQETVDRANDALAVKKAKRKGLEQMANTYGVKVIDQSTSQLRKEVAEAIDGNSD